MASSGTGSLVFVDDLTEDGHSRMNSEVHRNILSAHIQPNSANLIILYSTADPKHTAKGRVFQVKEVGYSTMAELIT